MIRHPGASRRNPSNTGLPCSNSPRDEQCIHMMGPLPPVAPNSALIRAKRPFLPSFQARAFLFQGAISRIPVLYNQRNT